MGAPPWGIWSASAVGLGDGERAKAPHPAARDRIAGNPSKGRRRPKRPQRVALEREEWVTAALDRIAAIQSLGEGDVEAAGTYFSSSCKATLVISV